MIHDSINPPVLLDRLLATPSCDHARVLNESGDAGASLAALIEHVSRTAMSDAVRGDQATDVVIHLADRVGSNLDRARARRARVHMLSFAGRFNEALDICDVGQQLARDAGQAVEAARLRLASMHALGELGRLDEAIAAGEAARKEFLAAGEIALAGRADLNLGTVRQRGDDPAAAIDYFNRAKSALVGDAAMLGPLENNRGEALLAMNRFADAERAFASALEAFAAQGAGIPAAIARSNLADVATRQGRLQAAMSHFEHARRALEGGASPAHLARLLAEQAEVMSLLGMHDDAVREFERALAELDRQGLVLESARARAGLGTTLLKMHRPAQAETALAAAALAFDEIQHQTARARVDLIRAELASICLRHADARSMALRALATLHSRPADAAAAHLMLARIATRDGRPRDAEVEFERAMTLAQDLAIAPMLAEILRQRGDTRRQCGLLTKAIDDFTAAMQHIERIRSSIQVDRFRAAFQGGKSDVYESLVGALLDRGEPDDHAAAFNVIERARSRTLLDALQCDIAEDVDGRSTDVTADASDVAVKLRNIRAELHALYGVMVDDQSISARRESIDRAWRQRVGQCEREADELEARLANTAGFRTFAGQPATLHQLQSALPSKTAVIEYFQVGDEFIAVAVTPDHFKVHRRLGGPTHIGGLLESLRFQIDRALRPGAVEGSRQARLLADAHRVLTELANLVLTPIAHNDRNAWEAEHLIVVPHGVLHGVPFHALMMDGRHIVETHVVSTIPCATLLTHKRGGKRECLLHRPVVVGCADDIAPEIELEAQCVAETLACPSDQVFRGSNARVERVLCELSEATLAHFACHGRYAADAPGGSGLKLADRWLTARDLMSIRMQAGLVTLSGCETGLSLVQAGDELQGLTRQFLAAGAKAVLAALWRVNDATTREFMTAFCSCLNTLEGDSHDCPAALARVQRAMLERQRHPAFWAPFQLTGSP